MNQDVQVGVSHPENPAKKRQRFENVSTFILDALMLGKTKLRRTVLDLHIFAP